MKIGFFDSGVGGLSVLEEALHRLPANEYLFYADTDHVPYGTKTEGEICACTMDGVRFLLSKGAEAVVVACNTATAVAIKALREDFSVPIIGMEPAVKPAVALAGEKRVMVIATPVTLRENKLKELLHRVDEEHRVDVMALPALVTYAEREEWDSEDVRTYLRDAFAAYDMRQYAALVLGCTHFLYFKPLYRELFGDDLALVDGNAGTVRRLAEVTNTGDGSAVSGIIDTENRSPVFHPPVFHPSVTFFESSRPVTDCARYERLLARLREIRH